MLEILVVICLGGEPALCQTLSKTAETQTAVSACEVRSRRDAALWASRNPGVGLLESCRQSKP